MDYGAIAQSLHLLLLAELQTLEQIMGDLGHQWLDVLKLDIEGGEFSLLSNFYADKNASLHVTQLLIEMHFPGTVSVVWDVFDKLAADGFRVFSTEPNYYCQNGCCAKDLVEFSFIKVSSDGRLCTPQESSASGRKPVWPHGRRPQP